ncbi:MAG TPA: diacylglycerol kinase family protein [Candidatus Dormibacteraeota bacterium]|jgi:diacylglycerol kinase (ATP)|nr:diacylglycerol kinase family protein [Candidatus Dormibacteraeota bacterium]
MKDLLVVVNPAAAAGRTGRAWPRIASRLRAAGLEFDVAMTSCPGEATRLAREAVRAGRPIVAAAGGDGTVHEVVNGFFEGDEPLPTRTRLGVVPAGTGGDFRRTLEVPLEPEAAAAVLRAGRSRRIDVGRLRCAAPEGGVVLRHFVNVADAGIGGEVVARVNRAGREGGLLRRLPSGELTFLLASLLTLLAWRNRPMRVVADGEARELIAQQVVVANGRYFGGGMKVAPLARPDDGLLDVVIAGDLSWWDNLRGLGRVRRGTHLDVPGPKILFTRARRVEVDSPEPVRVDADGEQPGSLPAVFEVVPGALEVICP